MKSKEEILDEIKALTDNTDHSVYFLFSKIKDAMQEYANQFSEGDGWVNIAIREPELGSEIWVWHLVFNQGCEIKYQSKDALQYFKFWQPLPQPPKQ